MRNRYFYKTDNGQNIKAVYRLIEDEENMRVHELIWLNQQWTPTDSLIRQLIGLDVNLDEVSESTIRLITPFVDTGAYTSSVNLE